MSEEIKEKIEEIKECVGKALKEIKDHIKCKETKCQTRESCPSDRKNNNERTFVLKGEKTNSNEPTKPIADLNKLINELLGLVDDTVKALEEAETKNHALTEEVRKCYLKQIQDYRDYDDSYTQQMNGQKAFESVGRLICIAAQYADTPDERITRVLRDIAANEKDGLEEYYSASAPEIIDRSDDINRLMETPMEELREIADAVRSPFVPYRDTLDNCEDLLYALCCGDLSRCKELKAKMEGMGYCFVMYGNRQREGMGTAVDYNVSKIGCSYPALYYQPRERGAEAMIVCHGGKLRTNDRAMIE